MKGEDFTEKHWLEVYTLLGIAPKALDVLCLKDFLNISETLIENTKKLQVCTTLNEIAFKLPKF